MTGAIVALVLVAIPIVALVFLLRDKRRGAGKQGTAANVMRSGMLDVQALLEPERKVEVLREQERKRDLEVAGEDEGDDPR